MALDGWKDYLARLPAGDWEKDYGGREAMASISQRKAVHEPVGVVGAITPWNVPLYVNVGKVVAALLAGCTVILKPAPNTPGMGAIFGELAAEAGFPAGVLNVVFGSDPALAGEMLVHRPARRSDQLHRLDRGRQADHGAGRGDAEARVPRTRRQIGEDRARRCARISRWNVATTMLVFHAGQGCAVQSRLLVPQEPL